MIITSSLILKIKLQISRLFMFPFHLQRIKHGTKIIRAMRRWKRLHLVLGTGTQNGKNYHGKNVVKNTNRKNPNIQTAIDYQELSTPLTIRDLAKYQKGEMYGIDHDSNRFRQRWLRPQSEIKNLFFTGQDIMTAGVSSALFSGMLTASTILKENLTYMIKN